MTIVYALNDDLSCFIDRHHFAYIFHFFSVTCLVVCNMWSIKLLKKKKGERRASEAREDRMREDRARGRGRLQGCYCFFTFSLPFYGLSRRLSSPRTWGGMRDKP